MFTICCGPIQIESNLVYKYQLNICDIKINIIDLCLKLLSQTKMSAHLTAISDHWI